MYLLYVPSPQYNKKTKATSMNLQQVLHVTDCSQELHTITLFLLLNMILLKYNFILKSASFALGFTSFLLWIPPELLMIL